MDKEQRLVVLDKQFSLNLEQAYEAVLRAKAMQNLPHNPMQKSQSADNISFAEEPKVGINSKNRQILGKNLDTPTANNRSSDFLVNVDSLVGNGLMGSRDKNPINRGKMSNYLTLKATITSDAHNSLQTENFDNDDKRNGQATSCNENLNDHGYTWKDMQISCNFPIFLKFSDVSYKVPGKGERSLGGVQYIVQGVTGSVNPGELLALMGPSGGGKTTLLNLLSGRVSIKGHAGCITYNDMPYSNWLKRRIGFVLQDDVVFPHLTVRETLTYAALLRLPSRLTKLEKEERAKDVIFKLGLERCQDTLIGGAFVRGISGGERKRVCIGNEILLDPSLLFLDEPTSGLDSTTALRIVQMLHEIANTGKTVVTTIHQPSSRLFNMFDKLILLGRGNLLYSGKASEAITYFSSIGCSPLIAMNPAEFLIDLANGNMSDKSIPSKLENDSYEFILQEGRPSPNDIHEYLLEAYATRFADSEKRKLLDPLPIGSSWRTEGRSFLRNWGASWRQQFCILFWRGLKERRHDYLSCTRVTQVLATAVITGLLWWHSDTSSPKKLQDQAGALFFISVFWGFFPVFTAIFTFPQERAMLAKERSVDMYKLSAYFMARNISDLPLDLLLPIIFLLIVYFMVGLKPVFRIFIQSMLTIFLSIIAAQGLGLAIGAAVMDVKRATTLASIVIMTFMLTGGFFIQGVPHFISWIRYLSFNYHAYRLLLKVQYGCSRITNSTSSLCKSPFLQQFGLDGGEMEVAAMIIMALGYRLLAYLLLRRMKLAKIA